MNWTVRRFGRNLSKVGVHALFVTSVPLAFAQPAAVSDSSAVEDSAKVEFSQVVVVASDINKLPDFNVTDALSRVSGEAAGLEGKMAREKSGARMDELAHRELQQRWLWTVIGGSFAMLGGAAYFLLRLRRKRNEIYALNIGLEQRVRDQTAELRQQARYLRTLIDTLPVSVWLKDTGGRYLTINTNPAGINGPPAEQMIGKTDEELWPDGIGQAFRAADLEVMETRQRKMQEVAIPDTDGAIFWREIDRASVIDEDGAVLGTVGVSRDISERKEAERKLKESLDFTEGIINAIPDLLFELDRDGRYLNIWAHNPELLAAQREVLLGKTVREALAPEAAETAMSAIAEADETGLSFGKVMHLDLPQGESWFELSVSKKPDGEGGGDHFIVLSRDITGRKRLEQQLFEREQEFRALAENTPDTIARYNRECIRTYINPAFARLAGKPDAMLGVTPSQFYSTPQSFGYEQSLRHVMESGEEGEYELTWAIHDGRLITSHIRIMPERGADGRVVSALAIGRDITDFKRYEAAREAALAEAMRLAKTRSEFLSHMSHELRTPLNGILGYAQILQQDRAMGGQHAAALNVIRQSGEHLLALIDDILDLARIETGRFDLVMSDIPLAKFVRLVADIVGVRARQKDIDFSCDLAPGLPEGIRGDERLLRQVLLNLLSNAVKFTQRGGVVLRVSRVMPSRLAFAVEDSGTGIAESDLERIFQPFEQANDARHRQGGTGLGLAISRQLVRLMGGDISVDSRVGEGSTFRFELELQAVELAPPFLPSASLPAQHASGYAGPRRKVLVVDDMVAPPSEALQALHRLALLGNMRDILQYAGYIDGTDPRYHPFASRLRLLAEGYQSKVILAFVEGYLHDSST